MLGEPRRHVEINLTWTTRVPESTTLYYINHAVYIGSELSKEHVEHTEKYATTFPEEYQTT